MRRAAHFGLLEIAAFGLRSSPTRRGSASLCRSLAFFGVVRVFRGRSWGVIAFFRSFAAIPLSASRTHNTVSTRYLIAASLSQYGKVAPLVNQEYGSIPGDPAQFRTTRWSAIFVAAESEMPGSQEALTTLCRDYWYPIYAFARRAGNAAPDAQDLTQGFFLSLLKRRVLKQADPARGKFRSFLLASFKHYLLDEADRAHALKRGGDREFVFLDAADAETRYQFEPADQLSPEKIYDAHWAVTLLNRAADRLREECIACGEISRFELLRPFVGVETRALPTYEEVAKTLGISLGAVKTWIHRFRKQYTKMLREEVSRTVSDPNEIDHEIRALCDGLVAAEGRL